MHAEADETCNLENEISVIKKYGEFIGGIFESVLSSLKKRAFNSN